MWPRGPQQGSHRRMVSRDQGGAPPALSLWAGSPSRPPTLPPREQLSHCAQSPPVQTAVPLLPHTQRRRVQKHWQPGWV